MADPLAPGSPTKARISPAALASGQLRSFRLAYLAVPQGCEEKMIHHCLGHPRAERLPPKRGCVPVSLHDMTGTVPPLPAGSEGGQG